MSWALAAAAAVGLAGVVLSMPVERLPTTAAGVAGVAGGADRAGAGRRWRWALAVAVGGGVVVGWPTRATVIALLLATSVVGAARLAGRRRTAREAEVVRGCVIELCGGLRAELAAGLTPAAALARAAEEWPAVATVARAADGGGDVPAAFRALAATPGAEALRIVAAAWQVAHRTGHGLAGALTRVGDDLRLAEQTRRVVVGELASARATARLMAVLPALALAMGSGAGAQPVRFLLVEPVGIACLAAGLLLTGLGIAWIDGLARSVERAS